MSVALVDLKNDLISNKSKLEILESKLEGLVSMVQEKKNFFDVEKKEIEDILNENKLKIIKFNVSGKIFKTRLSTLAAFPNTFFAKLVKSKFLINQDIIYLERDPFYFDIILNFLRFKTIDYNRFNSGEKRLLLAEANFYEISQIVKSVQDSFNRLEIVKFEFSGPYAYKGKIAGTNRLEDLSDKSLMKGICAASPGTITFTLNKFAVITSIDIAGYNGNSEVWNSENGSGASIVASEDKVNWTSVGTVPVGFGKEIKNVSLLKVKAKYLRFYSTTTYVGIGYLKLYSD